MKKLAIVTYLVIGSAVGIYAGLAVIENYLIQPAQAQSNETTGSFNDVWPLTTGLQGEEHPYQLQRAIGL